MKYTVFLSALVGIAAAKKPSGEKCLNENNMRCSSDRNQVEHCIQGHWAKVDFCQNPRFGVNKGYCTEEPTPACRKPESPVETVWDPPASLLSAATEQPSGVITLLLTPGVAPTNIPADLDALFSSPTPSPTPKPDIKLPNDLVDPSWR